MRYRKGKDLTAWYFSLKVMVKITYFGFIQWDRTFLNEGSIMQDKLAIIFLPIMPQDK